MSELVQQLNPHELFLFLYEEKLNQAVPEI